MDKFALNSMRTNVRAGGKCLGSLINTKDNTIKPVSTHNSFSSNLIGVPKTTLVSSFRV